MAAIKIGGKQELALIYLIRHGQPDYSPCDERGYIGHGDLAPLSKNGIKQAELTVKDVMLMDADIIVSSPYTRALQTAPIISKNTGIDIKVEMDLHNEARLCPLHHITSFFLYIFNNYLQIDIVWRTIQL